MKRSISPGVGISASPPPQPSSSPASFSRRRGGQPGNQNARKQGAYSRHHPGPLSEVRLRIAALVRSRQKGISVTPQDWDETLVLLSRFLSDGSRTGLRLAEQIIRFRVAKLQSHTQVGMKWRALAEIARSPLVFFEHACREYGISRDADSFFPVSKKSAQNSLVPAEWGILPSNHPHFATNLTDDQWALLAPLIPPDPHIEWLHGEPPVIIAANRWDFSRYIPTGEFQDLVILQEYRQVLEWLPAIQPPPPSRSSSRKRGRPRRCVPVRAVLDAIVWKLATAHNWSDLPNTFPPMRLVRKYYRRLYLSGRLYTLLLALYNHLRLEQGVDCYELFEQGIFTTSPSQNIALAPGVQPNSINCTALLFMQLAREAYTSFDRLQWEQNPHYPLLPVFKGPDPLTTAALPAKPTEPTFEPLPQGT